MMTQLWVLPDACKAKKVGEVKRQMHFPCLLYVSVALYCAFVAVLRQPVTKQAALKRHTYLSIYCTCLKVKHCIMLVYLCASVFMYQHKHM